MMPRHTKLIRSRPHEFRVSAAVEGARSAKSERARGSMGHS